jgi:hypothetical protein
MVRYKILRLYKFIQKYQYLRHQISIIIVGVITPGCLKASISQQATRPTMHQLAKAQTTEAQLSQVNLARR